MKDNIYTLCTIAHSGTKMQCMVTYITVWTIRHKERRCPLLLYEESQFKTFPYKRFFIMLAIIL